MECLQSHPSIILTIIQYLSIAEYVSLRRTLPCFIRRPSAYPLPIDLLKNRLDNKTRRLCMQDGVYLTGGHLLGHLLGEDYGKSSDIDLIVKESKDVLYRDSFEVRYHLESGYGDHHLQYCEGDDIYYNVLVRCKSEKDIYILHPYMQVYSRVVNCPYNLLYIFDGYIPDYIQSFDFGFCKNIADFNNKKLIIYDLESVLKRKYVFKKQDIFWKWSKTKDTNDLVIHVIERMHRYRNRGFEITFEDIDGPEEFLMFWEKIK